MSKISSIAKTNQPVLVMKFENIIYREQKREKLFVLKPEFRYEINGSEKHEAGKNGFIGSIYTG